MTTNFKYILENGMTLEKSQIDLLTKIENIPCSDVLADYDNLAELRKMKGYEVVVSDRMSFIEKMKTEDHAIDNLRNDLKEKSIKGTITEEERAIYNSEILFRIKKELNDYLERIDPGAVHPLLGLYRNWDFSYNSPVVYLFKENIDNYAKRSGKSADNIFAYVYIHEAMHAYYDSKNSEGGHVIHELEEAFAECGMLEFLTNACFHDKDLCEPAIDAYDDVREKQKNGPYEYGFGLSLYEISHKAGGKTSSMMSRYREISNWITDNDAYNYKAKISELSKTPLDNDEYKDKAQECFELVEKILNKEYQKPNVIADVNPLLEPYMRGSGVIVREDAPATWKHSGKSTSIATSSSIIYLGTKEKLGSSYRQVQIFASEDPTEMAYGIFKVADLIGGERAMVQMIYYYDYHCKDKFHVYSTSCLKRNGNVIYMHRPLSIGGNQIYIQKGWQLDPETQTAESPSLCLLLDALNAVSDKCFSILNSEKTMILYGPEDIKDAIESNQQER